MKRCSWIALLVWAFTGPGERVSLAAPPTPPGADAVESVPAPTSKFDRIQELLEAAKHLDAADDVELARQVRTQATRLLLEESARLAQEQRRLERLSVGLEPKLIQIQVTLAETSVTQTDKLARAIRQAGGDTIESDELESTGVACAAILGPSSDVTNLMLQFATDGTELNVLSRPQILVLDGSPAEIEVGQEVPVVSDQGTSIVASAREPAGIRVSLTPTLTAEGRIQLDVSVQRTEFAQAPNANSAVSPSPAAASAAIRTIINAKSSVKVPYGRTLILALPPESEGPQGTVKEAESTAEKTLLLLLQPKQRD
jgi:Flp pilus assembly secretin CpaC